MNTYDAARYLAAKKTVDDRALNREVWTRLRSELALSGDGACRVLEVGAGIGTMIARLVDWGALRRAEYWALDEDGALLSRARDWLRAWGERSGHDVAADGADLLIRRAEVEIRVRFIQADVGDFLARRPVGERFDLLIANAFLDLVELPLTLAELFEHVTPGGLYWFSINYDGETIFLPAHEDDDAFMQVYNRSMDERVRNGRPAGDSRTGRHLFEHLRNAGASILAAGASDWVVNAAGSAYQAEEGYFLHHILHTVSEELGKHAEITPAALEAWASARHAQVDRGELVYIAHQLDFTGRTGTTRS